MSAGQKPFYGRAQVAAALGISRMQAHRLLPGHSADAFTLRYRGGPAWTLPGLPSLVRNRLHAAATRAGCSIEELLNRPPLPRRWLTPADLLRMRCQRFNCALALRHFLMPVFRRYLIEPPPWMCMEALVNVTCESCPELAEMLGRRAVRTLVARALRRAKGKSDWMSWERLDLYVYGSALCQADRAWIEAVTQRLPSDNYHNSIFEEVAALVQERTAPTEVERAAVWVASFVSALVRETSCPQCNSADPRIVADGHYWIRRVTLRRILRSGVALMASRRQVVSIWAESYGHWKKFAELPPALALGKGPTIWRIP